MLTNQQTCRSVVTNSSEKQKKHSQTMAACINMAGLRTSTEGSGFVWPLSPRSKARRSARNSIQKQTKSLDETALTVRQRSETERSSDFLNIPLPLSEQEGTGSESTDTSSVLSIPESLLKSLPRLYNAELAPIDLKFGMVREEVYRLSVSRASRKVTREAVMKNAPKALASICFVVKRPGCVLCHEQGRALAELVSDFQHNQVAAWAVIKEIDVDNEGLLTLYQKYFKFPFFRDPRLALYTALGERKVGIVPNPFKIFKRYREIRNRLKEKNIEGNILGKGEGMILGGVIVFDRRGHIRYAHQEQFGRELPSDEIRAALKQVVNEEISRRNGDASSSSEFITK